MKVIYVPVCMCIYVYIKVYISMYTCNCVYIYACMRAETKMLGHGSFCALCAVHNVPCTVR